MADRRAGRPGVRSAATPPRTLVTHARSYAPGGQMAQATSPSMSAARGPNQGPIGPQRNIGKQILLSIVTLGFYGWYWAYESHEEIKQHTGEGVGGVVGVLIYIFVGIVTLFV